jgi:type IV pilus assembly protein PilF
MRHSGVALLFVLLVATLAAAGCSRLTFIKSNPDKRDYDGGHAPSYEVRDSPEVQRRHEARNMLMLAQREFTRGNFDAAEQQARKAAKASPESGDAWSLLALLAERRGRTAEAGDLHRRAAELAPKDGGTLNNYGTWLCGNGHAAESLVWFDRALAAPGYRTPALALANAGACAEKAGQVERAERDLRKAISLDPDNGVALGAMARVAFRTGRFMDARAFSQRHLATGRFDAASLQLASQIEQKLGDTAASARYVRRLRDEFPGAVPGNPGDATQR